MNAKQLRTKYLDFFKSKEHSIIPSASLIPENDPTVLFTTAGMHPLVPYLMGEKHPGGNKLTNVQKCIRTSDIEEVGDTTHHTFFEMMGNWSLGDPEKPDGIGTGYFKEEAIKMSWEFLTEVLELDKDKIAVTCFKGDKDAPKDIEAADVWKSLGVSKIKFLGKEDNWWGPAGETGPCGPDTEIFVNGVEIWNDVFMEYNKDIAGNYNQAKQKNVDTGMGLERTLAVLNNLDDNYQTELWLPIIKKIEKFSRASINLKKNAQTEEEFESNGVKYKDNKKAFRIIADHIKAATMILGNDKGIAPSNAGQGYVLRRLIRRAIRYAKIIGIKESHFTFLIAKEVIKIYKDVYPELTKNKDFIQDELVKEEQRFVKTLEKGLKEFNKYIQISSARFIGDDPSAEKDLFKEASESEKIMPREIIFRLYDTYGFPIEMIEEEAKKQNIQFRERQKKEFEEDFKKHQEKSRTASAGQFKGGLADASDETKKLHTTAHLMLEAMRRVLGDHVQQKGSNITPERLRFDFSHGEKLTDEQKQEIEKLVNQQIEADLPITVEEMSVAEAKKLGATGVFDSKYGEKVKVYSVGEFSKEICGGPHVEHTGELGKFKIKKEQSSSAGVRRIKAVLV